MKDSPSADEVAMVERRYANLVESYDDLDELLARMAPEVERRQALGEIDSEFMKEWLNLSVELKPLQERMRAAKNEMDRVRSMRETAALPD